jgi:hypothetical protein
MPAAPARNTSPDCTAPLRGRARLTSLLAAGLLLVATAGHATSGSVQSILSINGKAIPIDSKSGQGFVNSTASGSGSPPPYTYALRGTASRTVGGAATLTGAVTATAQLNVKSSFIFDLTPPATADFRGGRLVFHFILDGTVTKNASLGLKGTADAVSSRFIPAVSNSVAITSANDPRVEFDVALALPGDLDPKDVISGSVQMVLDVNAFLTGDGTSTAADAGNSGRLAGYSVFNSLGAQVTGFTMNSEGTIVPELKTGGASQAEAIEYFNASFGHYFITQIADEIAKLDSGVFAGWKRTGQSFSVYTSALPALHPVCRFFTIAFPPSSSHFYAPRGFGCEPVLTNPKWVFEGDVFFSAIPDASGNCPTGQIPVYRLYNNGQGGAPNHRFTTSLAIRTEMLNAGYVAEGNGIGVGMCSPQ